MMAFHRTLVRKTVIVNLVSGKAFRGVLWARRGPLYVLRGTALLEPGRSPIAVDGEVVVERSMVEFVQVLPAVVTPVELATRRAS